MSSVENSQGNEKLSDKISHVTGCGTSVTDTARANTSRGAVRHPPGRLPARIGRRYLKCWGKQTASWGTATADRTSPEATAVVNLGSGRTAKIGSAGRRSRRDTGRRYEVWGNNGDGELGYGDTTSRNSPEATAVVDRERAHGEDVVGGDGQLRDTGRRYPDAGGIMVTASSGSAG